MLSTLSLLQTISQFASYREVALSLIEYPMLVNPIFKDWCGIDSTFCVILLALSIENNQEGKRRFTHVPKGTDKKTMVKIYKAIWNIYEQCCKDKEFKFIPCLSGLSTILSRGTAPNSKKI